MKLAKKMKQLVMKCDFFKTTQFLRYKGQSEYRTFTGGFCSIVISIVFAVVFYSAVLSTIQKTKISWGYTFIPSITDQLHLTVSTKIESKFMFAVGINNLNMNDGQRYFDLKLLQVIATAGVKTQKQFPLYPCQRSVWQGSSAQVMQIYDRYNFSQLLCPPDNISIEITGSRSAYNFKYIKVAAVKCNPSLSSRPCANSSTLSDFLANNQNFHLNVYFINKLLNPSNQQAIIYYLQDRNYVPFNLVSGGSTNIHINKYKLSTDQSIWPLDDPISQEGGIVNYVGQFLASSVFGDQYASINFKRTRTNLDIYRSYTKMDNTLSYIGGLFGFLMIAFIFMKVYTQYSYEIQMGDQLYYYSQNTSFDSNRFHFMSFLLYVVYSFFSFFGCSIKFQLMNKFDSCRNEVQKQFDITFLMKRLIFFERSLKILFEDHQFKGLHMHDKMTLKDAQQLRSYYRLRDKMKVKMQDNSDNQFSYDKQSEEENSHSHEINFTDNIITVAPEQKRSPKFGSDQKQQFKRYSYTRKVHPEQEQNKPEMDSSELLMQEKLIEMKKMRQNNHQSTPQYQKTDLSSKIKILRKQSESGNKLSKKILEGLDNTLLKNILLKIQEKVQKEDNQIFVRENENDFQIRISKRGYISQQRKVDQKFEKLINNIEEQKLEQQVSKVQISSAYQQQEFNLNDSATSKGQKKKAGQDKKDDDHFQYAI